LSASHNRVGDVLVSQGDGPGALGAYRKALAICEALVALDSSNAQWSTDVAVSYSKLGLVEEGQTVEIRRGHLMRGRSILVALKVGWALEAEPGLDRLVR
jgi:hypothetical protein